MKIKTRRKIYYTSVIIALVVILVCAVIINRTLVNTPKIEPDSISTEAGEPVSAYMAYMNGERTLVTGIAEEGDADTAEIIALVKNTVFDSEYSGSGESGGSIPDAWVVLYDAEKRIASRMNFYEGGTAVWFDGTKYDAPQGLMQKIIDFCNANIRDEQTEAERIEQSAEQTGEE